MFCCGVDCLRGLARALENFVIGKQTTLSEEVINELEYWELEELPVDDIEQVGLHFNNQVIRVSVVCGGVEAIGTGVLHLNELGGNKQ